VNSPKRVPKEREAERAAKNRNAVEDIVLARFAGDTPSTQSPQ